MTFLVNLINFVLELKKFWVCFFFSKLLFESLLFLTYFHYSNWIIQIQNDFPDSITEVEASLAFSPFLLFRASVQITPTSCTYVLYSLLLCTHPNKIPCCVTFLKPSADYREVVSHTSYLILKYKVTCL